MAAINADPPFISVIIVSYNYGRFLVRALNACRAQTFRDFEIVVVDNGSTDDTADIVQRFAAENPELTLKSIRIAENRGLPPGRNSGLDAAGGKFLLFNDADDWMDERCLELLAQKAIETDADKIIGLERYCNENGKVAQGTFFSKHPVKWLHNRLQATLYRRSIFVDNAVRWTDIWQEDYYINLNFNIHCRTIAVVPVVLYNYFVQNSLFVSTINNKADRMRMVMDQSCGFTKEALNHVTDPGDRRLIEYQMIKFYYLILLSYNRKNGVANALANYGQLKAIFEKHFPRYLSNESIRLFSDNHDRVNGRLLMLMLSSFERLHIMRPLLAVYVLLSSLSK